MNKNYEMYTKISSNFDKAKIRYCALKGLVFCAGFYELRERRSNDLVPYVKYVGDSVMKIDINFRFDPDNNDIDKIIFERGIICYNKNLKN